VAVPSRGIRAAKEGAVVAYAMFLFFLAYQLNMGFLSTVGLIFFLAGVALSVSGALGHSVGGHKYWY
jgi:hypothetical protein